MSVVTDIMLMTMVDEPHVEDINSWIAACYDVRQALHPVHEQAGGLKALQCDLFVGTLKNLNLPWLVETWAAVPWDYPDSTQLFIKTENEDRFTVFQLDELRRLRVLTPAAAVSYADHLVPPEMSLHHGPVWVEE